MTNGLAERNLLEHNQAQNINIIIKNIRKYYE